MGDPIFGHPDPSRDGVDMFAWQSAPFVSMLEASGVTAPQGLAAFVTGLLSQLHRDKQACKKWLKFSFKWFLEEGIRTMAAATAAEVVGIVYKGHPKVHADLLASFTAFLKTGSVKVINEDSFVTFLDFSEQFYSDPALKSYDPADSWPLVLDEWVEWHQAAANAK